MIRTTALLAGLTTLAASARVTHITILFKKLDKNNDGVLDKDEIPLQTVRLISGCIFKAHTSHAITLREKNLLFE